MKRLLLSLISFYKQKISPKKAPCCRYSPTCSSYGYEAIERWGVIVGGYLALFRILRCNPMYKGGYDPVPLRISKTEYKR